MLAEVEYNFIPQTKNPRIVCTGYLGMDKGTAHFTSNEKIIELLERAKVEYITPHGIFISGFLQTGIDKQGKMKYTYREWYCSYRNIECSPKQ